MRYYINADQNISPHPVFDSIRSLPLLLPLFHSTMRLRIAAALTFVGATLSGVQAIQTVSRAGRYLYTADGNRFYIKGVAYQEQGAHSR